jgi:hypothetical protein
MQLYSLIIPSINPEKKEDLFYLINEINAKLPIGSISVNKMAELGFKFIFPVPRFEIPKEHQFIEIFTLYRNSLICFKDIINQFTNGSLSLKQVLAKLEDNEL